MLLSRLKCSSADSTACVMEHSFWFGATCTLAKPRVWGQGVIPKVMIRLASLGTVGSEADPSCPFLAQYVTSSKLCTSTTMPRRAGVTWRLHHLSWLLMLILEGSSKKSNPCFNTLTGSVAFFTQDRSMASKLSTTFWSHWMKNNNQKWCNA